MDQVGRSVPVHVIVVFRMRSQAEGVISDLLHTHPYSKLCDLQNVPKPVNLYEFSLPE